MKLRFWENKSAAKKKKPQKVRKPKTTEADHKAEPSETVAGSGQIMQKKSATAGKVAAFAFIGFVGLGSVISFSSLFSPASVAEPVIETEVSTEEQQAAEYARGYVGAWLRSTSDNDAEISRYMQIEQGDITAEKPTEYRELAVASMETDDTGVSTIIVSAEVETPAGPEEEEDQSDNDEPLTQWEPTWYQVNIYNDQGSFVPLGWPAPVSAPETGSAPRMGYTYESSDEIETTVSDFFEAYILENGEVSRLTHPDSTITPLGNPTYTDVEIQEVTTDEDFRDQTPQDGTTAQAYVYLQLGTSQDQGKLATYALTLEVRGGRWEVRTLEPAPVVQPAEITAEESPTVSPDDTDENAQGD